MVKKRNINIHVTKILTVRYHSDHLHKYSIVEIYLLAEFKIGFADHTVATTVIIRLTTDTTVIDKTVGSQLCQNFVKFGFISRTIFLYSSYNLNR